MMNSPTASPTHPSYRPDIDGLRAIAVISVVAFHAFPSVLEGGFIGVDIFFVISGFLISSILYAGLDKGTFSFADFYARRVKRIFPALLLVLFSSLVFGWFALDSIEYQQLGKHIVAGAGFVSNFVLWSEAGYFDKAADTKPLLHLWSLAVEEQFYIVWPLVLWCAWKRQFNLFVVTILVALGSFIAGMHLTEKDSVTAFYSPLTRIWEMLVGSLLAWFTRYKASASVTDQNTLLINVMSGVGCLLLLLGFVRITKNLSFPVWWALVPVLGAALIIGAGPKAWINRVVLSNKILVWFGLISFPLYLWHWPLFSFARIVLGGTPSVVVIIVLTASSVLLAWLTYKIVENPIRKANQGRHKVAFLVLMMVLVAVLAFFVNFQQGVKSRTIAQKYDAILSTALSSPKRDECHFQKETESLTRAPCEYFYPNSTIAIVGNSHATELAYSLANELKPYGKGILHYTMSHCYHTDRIRGKGIKRKEAAVCAQWLASIESTIAQSEHINTVVISFRNEQRIDREHYRAALLNMVNQFVESNKTVYFILQAPILEKHIRDVVRGYVGIASEGVQEMLNIPAASQSIWLEQYGHAVDLLRAMPASVIVIDPADYFCNQGQCYAVKEGIALYFDDDHMSLAGSRIVAKEIVSTMHEER